MDNEAIKEVIGSIMKLSNTILGSIAPEDAKKHFRSACKEALLGMIVILNHANEKQKDNTSEGVHPEKQSSHNINITD